MTIRRFFKVLEKYLEASRITVREELSSPAAFFGRMIVHAFRAGMFTVVYSYVFRSSGFEDVNGVTLQAAIWTLSLVQVMHQAEPRRFSAMKDEILSGQVETKINKPFSLITYYVFECVGPVFLRFVGSLVVSFVVVSLLVGIPEVRVEHIVWGIPLAFLGIFVGIFIEVLIVMSAFWVENPHPFLWIVRKATWIFSGTFVPVAMLSPNIQEIANYLPLSAPYFFGRILDGVTVKSAPILVGMQIVWFVVLWGILRWVYSLGVKKVSINGG